MPATVAAGTLSLLLVDRSHGAELAGLFDGLRLPGVFAGLLGAAAVLLAGSGLIRWQPRPRPDRHRHAA